MHLLWNSLIEFFVDLEQGEMKVKVRTPCWEDVLDQNEDRNIWLLKWYYSYYLQAAMDNVGLM
jgi:hypothetical protein